jgi:hypothetical protein
MNCWICGDLATSGEHKTKQSDLRAVLGKPSQTHPFYYHEETIKNRRMGSFKGDFLKSPSRLCAPCNNHRSQPYDRAWERMSHYLRARTPQLRAGDFVRGNRVYPANATQEMRNVQLYFTKLTGCHLIEAGLKFDQATLAGSVLSGKSNTYIHLKFGISKTGLLVGATNLRADTLAFDNSVAFAIWVYSLDRLVVHVMYSIAGEHREGLQNAWHPRLGSNRFILADFP